MEELIVLYNVPRNSRIDVSHLNLETNQGKKVKELDFKHIDGMYSLCYFGDYPIHLRADTEVKIVK